jgi:hypothetical protein
VIECLTTITGGTDKDAEVRGQTILPDEILEPPRAQSLLERSFRRLWFGRQDFVRHGLTLPYRRLPPKPVVRDR